MTYCLDTNVIIAMMRNESAVIARLKSKNLNSLKVPEVVRAELLLGCLKSAHPDRERAKVEHVIAPFEWLLFGNDAVEHYATIRYELERSGARIGPNDLLIAATARSYGAVMVTSNVVEASGCSLVTRWLPRSSMA
jgi:tRNA(fMet)-specific endonuclease VapC